MFKLDASKIVRDFAAVVATESGEFRDLSELPHKKKTIEKCLIEVIDKMRDAPADQLGALKLTYLALADFQKMTKQQVMARGVVAKGLASESLESQTFAFVEELGKAMETLDPIRERSEMEFIDRQAKLKEMGLSDV